MIGRPIRFRLLSTPCSRLTAVVDQGSKYGELYREGSRYGHNRTGCVADGQAVA